MDLDTCVKALALGAYDGQKARELLSDIWDSETTIGAFHAQQPNNDWTQPLKILAITGNRLWSVTLGITNRIFDAESVPVSTISELKLLKTADKVTLKIGAGRFIQELSASHQEAKSLIALHNQLTR